MPRCSFKSCKSDSRISKNKKLRFYPFPKMKSNPIKCVRWIELCGSEKLNPNNITRNTYLCNKHFSEKFTKDSEPRPFLDDSRNDGNGNIATVDPVDINSETQNSIIGVDEGAEHISEVIESDHNYCHLKETSEIHTQTCMDDLHIFLYRNLMKNEKKFKYITGLRLLQFEALYEFLDESIMDKLIYPDKNYERPNKTRIIKLRLTNRDCLCLTLARMRRGYTLDELSIFYDMSKANISKIFYTWVQFMYYQIISIRGDMFSGGRDISRVPLCFRNFEKKNITLIIDATEISLQMPSNFYQQGNTFSSYKHSNTIKFLIGICPNGGVTYVSEGYEGAISDKELFEKCDLNLFLQEGDVILADRGFIIEDIANELKIKVFIPPFLKNRKRLTPEEERLTKKIAKSRVHVERAIRNIKSYRILSKQCPILLLPIISNIFTIVSFLVNFQDCLVP